MIRKCSCEHPYQDAKYGPGQRVHNPTKDRNVTRCTVCDRTSGSAAPKVEKPKK